MSDTPDEVPTVVIDFDREAALAADEATVRSVAEEVPVDPAFRPRVESLLASGVDVVVVSDGFGFVAERACVGLDVDLRTNHVDFTTGRLVLR